MACVNKFGIIECFDKEKNYSVYEPEKYNCIIVHDDIINKLIKPLSVMRSYWQSYSRPEFGLNHWGVTLIPPESLDLFFDVFTNCKYFKTSEALVDLANVVIKAKNENKYVIHFGV